MVHKTTIHLEPGIYRENIAIDGFASSSNPSADANLDTFRPTATRGLVIAGDPRVITGTTWIRCQTIERGNYEFIGAPRVDSGFSDAPISYNDVTAPTFDTIEMVPLGLVSESTIDFVYAGVQAGDIVVVSNNMNENAEIPVLSVGKLTLQLDLANASPPNIITNLTDTFSGCGSSFTIMPNRIIVGRASPGPFQFSTQTSDDLPPGSAGAGVDPDNPIFELARQIPFSTFLINQPVTMYGVWLKLEDPAEAEIEIVPPDVFIDFSNITSFHVAIGNEARLYSVVQDNRMAISSCSVSGGDPDGLCSDLLVFGKGSINTYYNDASFVGNNNQTDDGFFEPFQQPSTTGGRPLFDGFTLTLLNSRLTFMEGSTKTRIKSLIMPFQPTRIFLRQHAHAFIEEIVGNGQVATFDDSSLTCFRYDHLRLPISSGFTFLSARGSSRFTVDFVTADWVEPDPGPPTSSGRELFSVSDDGQIYIDRLIWYNYRHLINTMRNGGNIRIQGINSMEFPNRRLDVTEEGNRHATKIYVYDVEVKQAASNPTSLNFQPSYHWFNFHDATFGVETVTMYCNNGYDMLFYGQTYHVYTETAFAHRVAISGACSFRFPGGTTIATITSGTIGDGFSFFVTTNNVVILNEIGTITYS